MFKVIYKNEKTTVARVVPGQGTSEQRFYLYDYTTKSWKWVPASDTYPAD